MHISVLGHHSLRPFGSGVHTACVSRPVAVLGVEARFSGTIGFGWCEGPQLLSRKAAFSLSVLRLSNAADTLKPEEQITEARG